MGRPLPYGSAGVAAQPPMPSYDPGAALAQAQALLDADMPFHAHEILEDTWKLAPERERDLWQGLAQLAVGVTHSLRGNRSGAAALIQRGAARIAAYQGDRFGLELDGILGWADHAVEVLGSASTAGSLGVPRLTPA